LTETLAEIETPARRRQHPGRRSLLRHAHTHQEQGAQPDTAPRAPLWAGERERM